MCIYIDAYMYYIFVYIYTYICMYIRIYFTFFAFILIHVILRLTCGCIGPSRVYLHIMSIFLKDYSSECRSQRSNRFDLVEFSGIITAAPRGGLCQHMYPVSEVVPYSKFVIRNQGALNKTQLPSVSSSAHLKEEQAFCAERNLKLIHFDIRRCVSFPRGRM